MFFLHVTAVRLFSLLSYIPSYDYALFIQTTVNGWLGGSQVLAVLNEAAKNSCIHTFCGPNYSFLLGNSSAVELMGHGLGVDQRWKGLPNSFPKCLCQF